MMDVGGCEISLVTLPLEALPSFQDRLGISSMTAGGTVLIGVIHQN